ncbi:aminotransferase class V-fold PLP-dependent enzyme [Candidatus Latescibacterota bacterium]
MKREFTETRSLIVTVCHILPGQLIVAALTALVISTGCNEKPVSPALRIPIPTYESIGVKPAINARGAITVLGGSLMPPEVKMAMDEASKSHVYIEELMEGVGKRLAELTGAEWGIVTSGAAGAIFASTAASVTGMDISKNARFPDTTGMKSEAVIPSDHNTGYHDAACRMVGLKLVQVDTAEEMEAAINDNTAIIFALGQGFTRGGITLEEMVRIGKKHGVPVMVDAAAERPDVPNMYLEAGCDLVCYSGGKALFGPQCSGLLIGRKDLCQAAFMNISPHGGMGRPMKVGKEEIMGLLTAVDLWINGRDHDAEWKEWERKLKYISDKISKIPTVQTKVLPPPGRIHPSPTLNVVWDTSTVKITSEDVRTKLYEGNPRIGINSGKNNIGISVFMVQDGEEIVVANRIYDILSKAQ